MTLELVSNETHVKLVRRKDETLTSIDKVIRDLLERAGTAPVAVSNEPCKQCSEYKKQFDEMKINTVSLQRFDNMKEMCDKEIDEGVKLRKKVEELDEENEKLMDHFNAANDEIERLGGNQVLLDDPEYTETPAVQVESTEPTTKRRGLSQEQIDEMNEEAEKEILG